MKKVVIVGASGFVGTSLVEMFHNENFEVISVQRKDLENIPKLVACFEKSTLVINLAGANIVSRWSDEYKKLLYSSRINTTQTLLKAFEQTIQKPKLFISTSAVGIYKNDAIYDENSENLGDDFLANLCKDWEKEALKAQEFGIRTAIFRFGIVMGKGGALEKMLPPFKLGFGGTIGDGSQPFSFVHIEDLKEAYNFLLQNEELSGVFNLTAPIFTTNKGLTQALGKTLHRPTLFPVPLFVLKLIFGEGAKVLTDGQKVIPNRLMNSGFHFKFKNIEDTIENLVGSKN